MNPAGGTVAAASRTTPDAGYARTAVCGLGFDNLTLEEAVDRIDQLVRSGRSAYVVTPNFDHVVRARRDPAYASVVQRADLVLADGQPIVWAARLAGTPLKERVAGSDLFPLLCGHAAAAGFRVFFLGGAGGAAEAAADVLKRRFPRLDVTGTYCPPFGFEQNPEQRRAAVRAVRSARPEIVFVGLGSPKQERWMVEHMHEFGPAVSVGVGISFSFAAGQVPRAPRWMQRSGLEWLHRLWREPRRLWKRYLIDAVHLLPLLAESLGARFGPKPALRPHQPMRVDD